MKTIIQLLVACLLSHVIIAQPKNTTITGTPNSWTQKADFGGGIRESATGFSLNGKGYTGLGWDGQKNTIDFWEYDPAIDKWTRKADFPGTARSGAVGFAIGNKGYVGGGTTDYYGPYFNDFWEYDPSTDTWKRLTDFPGIPRHMATAFSIGNKGYYGVGANTLAGDIFYNDFWEYDPATNKWTQKADYGGGGRSNPGSFSIGTKGYIGCGFNWEYGMWTKDFWEYDPPTDKWTRKADFGGASREFISEAGFSIGDKGYLGTGYAFGVFKDFWEYDRAKDQWTQKADFGGTARVRAVGFSIGNKGYLGTGANDTKYKDFWEYAPSEILPLQLLSFTAALQKINAVLKWQTANEVNTAHFNIQRSFNGNDFTTIAKQNAAGNGIKQAYIYSDENVTALQQTTIFYRLQMVDRDGSFTYSGVVQLTVSNSDRIQFAISPNPAKDKLHISISCTENTKLSLRIADMQGRQVYGSSLAAVSGTVHKDIDISKLAKGMYNIQLISNQGTSKSSFVKE